MVNTVHKDSKAAEDWMATQAPMGPEDPREKWVTEASQAHLPPSSVLPKLKVTEVTQDFQGPRGIQEHGVCQGTLARQACLAHPA